MKQNISEIIRHIAKREGILEREVLDEMQKVIDEGYNAPDPAVQARWAAMPFDGKPTPEEFIVYLAEKVRSEN